MKLNNIVSTSGGKDSTATILYAIAMETEHLQCVFADTGHEHPETYAYLDYLEKKLDITIRRVKPDFSMQIMRKRKKLEEGKLKGWNDANRDRALEILQPTGVPFLDLCLWKGRFPSTKARFCTEELKRNPIIEQVFLPLLDAGQQVYSWQGVRRDESLARRYVPEFEEIGGGLFNYRPIARWNVESVFEAHRYFGIEPNPLYKKGMGRVGCMPCINCGKDELHQIALRFPEEIDRVREWEQLVGMASRRGSATFFLPTEDPTYNGEVIHHSTHGIDRRVEWSKTQRGGRLIDMFKVVEDASACSSAYGLCEGY